MMHMEKIFAAALIENVANSGHIINTDAIIRSYTGGCVGRNNGKVDKLYNSAVWKAWAAV